jgi:hypothetical protein
LCESLQTRRDTQEPSGAKLLNLLGNTTCGSVRLIAFLLSGSVCAAISVLWVPTYCTISKGIIPTFWRHPIESKQKLGKHEIGYWDSSEIVCVCSEFWVARICLQEENPNLLKKSEEECWWI